MLLRSVLDLDPAGSTNAAVGHVAVARDLVAGVHDNNSFAKAAQRPDEVTEQRGLAGPPRGSPCSFGQRGSAQRRPMRNVKPT